MTHFSTPGLVVGILLVGFLAGSVAGWVARTEQNRGWVAGVVRQLEATRAQLAEALADLDEAHAELDAAHAWRVERVSPAPTPAPEIHVHIRTTPAVGYQDLAGATAQALAGQLPRVLEAGP
ncbi:MAG: hypothetical protein ACRDQ6_00445 [Pseudonocardiaceae bacterium]